MRMSTEYFKQRGASALEASLAIVPVLLVCLLGLELVHAHQSKQLVSLALQEAGRTASITAADRDKVNQTLAQALAPLFMPAGQYTSALARLEATIARYERLYALPLWQLELTELTGQGAHPHSRRAMQLDLIYLHEPRLSWLRQALGQSARWLSTQPDGLAAKARQKGLVAMPLSRRVVLHAGETKHGSKRGLEAVKQTSGHQLNLPQTLRQTLTQTRAASTPIARFYSTTEQTQPTKHSTLGSFQQTLDKDDLCGVLLCCAQ
jgi:hypothetical protein